MPQAPRTRHSLILRLKNRSDADAWNQFVELYEPLVYRMMIKCGLQPSDAGDQTQEVMASVAKAINRWSPDEDRGKFRTWLYRISKNTLADYWKKLQRIPQSGLDSEFIRRAESDQLDDQFDKAFRERIFVLAAEKIKAKVSPKTWNAFWMSSMEQVPVDEIAKKLSLSPGNVYVAKSRVMKQLQDAVQMFLRTER